MRTVGRVAAGSALLGLGSVMILMLGTATAEPHGAVCRVHNRLATSNTVGSGTLVDRTDDGREGLVLTCAHLFSEGVGKVVVEFPGGKTHGAKLVALDREADLAALAISNPDSERAQVVFEVQPTGRLRACGFGPHGEYRCAQGGIVGEANKAGQTSVLVGDAVRSGDSGGGVFDEQGNLVAVVWGEAGGVTYASSGAPLRRFLDRVLGKRTAFVYRCPNGGCPRVPRSVAPPVVSPPPVAEFEAANAPPGSAELEEIERRLAVLERGKQDRGDYVTRAELAGWSVQSSVAEGIAGPTGWGVVAATTVGGWLVGLLWRRVGGRRGSSFPHGSKSGGLRGCDGGDVSRSRAADRT